MSLEMLTVHLDILLDILIIAIIFIGGLFTKHYLPTYMDKKGENLATKEDVEEITKLTEQVQKEFNEAFELFSSDVKFKYEYNYKQYSELYCKLYAIVVQSEYVRRYIKLCENEEISFEEAPFLEMSPTHRVSEKITFGESGSTVNRTVEDIETPISQFNKKELCDYIIKHGDLAYQELLKLAVSYRFAYSNYSGNPECKNSSTEKVANDEEFRMIRSIVVMIVKEYNELRKMLRLSYEEKELTTGVPSLIDGQ